MSVDVYMCPRSNRWILGSDASARPCFIVFGRIMKPICLRPASSTAAVPLDPADTVDSESEYSSSSGLTPGPNDPIAHCREHGAVYDVDDLCVCFNIEIDADSARRKWARLEKAAHLRDCARQRCKQRKPASLNVPASPSLEDHGRHAPDPDQLSQSEILQADEDSLSRLAPPMKIQKKPAAKMTRTSGTNCDHVVSLSQKQHFARMLCVLHHCVLFIVHLLLLKSFCFLAHVYHIHAVMLWCWHARILISCSVSCARWSFACLMMRVVHTSNLYTCM